MDFRWFSWRFSMFFVPTRPFFGCFRVENDGKVLFRGGIAAMNILQMQPGLITGGKQAELAQRAQLENPCAIGQARNRVKSRAFGGFREG